MRRLLALLSSATLLMTLSVTAAAPARAYSTSHTLAQAEAKLTGLSVGPNANTYFGQATITGTWTSYLDCHNRKHYIPRLSISNHNPTVAADSVRETTAPSSTCTPGITGTAPGVVDPQSWFNPLSWNWSKIWGSLWDTISKCMHGAASGVINTLTAQAAAAAIVEGASFEVTAAGTVVLALGGCFAGIGW